MTPLPKRRHSTQRSGKRTKAVIGQAAKLSLLVKCENCGQLKKPHLACPSCGQYKNRMVLPPKKEKKKPHENS